MKRNCIICNKEFKKQVNCSLSEWTKKRKTCSKECGYILRRKMEPWNKGLKGVQKAWNKGFKGPCEQDSPSWKGSDVSYSGLHHWVNKKLGKPKKCEFCRKDGLTGHKIHWANKSREYKRIIDDWIRLCASCHIKYDRVK